MTTPISNGSTAEIIGSRCRRGRSGGAGISTSTPPYGPVDARRPVELDAVVRGDGLDGAQVVADRQRQVAEQGGLARAQDRRRDDRRVADDDPVLRAEVGDRDHVADRDAGVAAGRLLVLDDDVVVRVATERVVAVAQRVLGLGAGRGGHDEGGAERLRGHRERGVDRVDERQPVARPDVDVGHPVVPARRLAGPRDLEGAAVGDRAQERQGVGDVTERGRRFDVEHHVGGAVGAVHDLDAELHRIEGTDGLRSRVTWGTTSPSDGSELTLGDLTRARSRGGT